MGRYYRPNFGLIWLKIVPLRPVYTCNICCVFQCDFLLLTDVKEEIDNECSEYITELYYITGGSARGKKVSPKTWRIFA